MKPPYYITSEIISLISSISEKLGAINATHIQSPKTELRKTNRIKTIQASLEIEGNTLTIDQVTALIENKRVIAPQKDILEVKNAILVYDDISKLKASNMSSFLKAHSILMKGLVRTPGKYRSEGAGIVKGSKLTHLAPKAGMVKALINQLFDYIKKEKDSLLIKSCVFHYELEFIHPFEDGNGRMGRLWQTVILKDLNPIFTYLPVESIIKQRQSEYYDALEVSDKSGNSTVFIEFMLGAVNKALEEILEVPRASLTSEERLNFFGKNQGQNEFSRKDYLKYFKEISSATASRDIKTAVEQKLIRKTGDKRTAIYCFKK